CGPGGVYVGDRDRVVRIGTLEERGVGHRRRPLAVRGVGALPTLGCGIETLGDPRPELPCSDAMAYWRARRRRGAPYPGPDYGGDRQTDERRHKRGPPYGSIRHLSLPPSVGQAGSADD